MFTSSKALQAGVAGIIIIATLYVRFPCEIAAQAPNRRQAIVTIDPTRPRTVFDPNRDLGAGIDGHGFGEVNKLLSPANIKEMLSVGFKPITYRLRTELADDAWHWNPKGSWSDESGERGYWNSDSRSDTDISLSYGYHLPRRGNTIDQANNNGYSRIDDGDTNSFWKSDPYLDKYFTKEDNALHQQWVVVDLGRDVPVNAIRILWGLPFAVDYKVQWGKITDISDISQDPPGLWHTFANGAVNTKTGGDVTTRLSGNPVTTRYVRVLLVKSSNSAAAGSKDPRDGLGFAIREIYVGTSHHGSPFADAVRHGSRAIRQSNIIVSSTDSWHRSTDIDHKTEHIGFDRLFKSGLTGDAAVLIPVSMLFGTPENAAAEIGYLNEKGYKIDGVELGEEPDGQYISPEDYGTLYVQWADAIHRVAPHIKLGGPSLQEVQPDSRGHKVELDNAVWFERFIHYLEKRGRDSDLSFFSFEWYPFDEVCKPTPPQIAQNADLLASSINAFRRHGLKADVPIVISEYGFSAFPSRAEVDIEGALFNADTIGVFLALGGSRAYLYGYEMNNIERSSPCTAGNNALFLGDKRGNIKDRTATYFGARLTMQEWLQPAGGDHKFYVGKVTVKDSRSNSPVAAYVVQRPDKQWSVMMINRDARNTWKADLRFKNENEQIDKAFTGDLDVFQFSRKEYRWDATLESPTRTEPPEHIRIDGGKLDDLQFPPYSLTVIRGSIK